MSEKDKGNSEIRVLYSAPSQQQLMTTNRWLVRAIVFFMAVIFVTGFLLLPSEDFLINYKKVTAAEVADKISTPALSAEVTALKGQFVGLLSGSIESKLRSLEESVHSGTLANSLGTIEDLKNDVRMLRVYSEPVSTPAAIDNQQIIKEVSQLKRLIYLTFASCGLMFAVVAGVWLRNVKKLPFKESIIRYLTR
ncbi:MAG: hypothetical protein K9L60_11230 [Methylovulum sp.]|jgi:hypothetical protein|nr:hypothetical protein [Methylovulum sp.]MCF8006948.1 hypothetical protein [Methylovulum sp.]